MFPHEKYLQYALEDCKISKVVSDLGLIYVNMVNNHKKATDDDFRTAMAVDRILKEASLKIADLGPKVI